jgi:UDP-glucose 4-epimerase
MARAIVTGGSGFIGSHLVDRLLADGYEVLVVDDLSTGVTQNLDSARKEFPDKLRVLEESICSEAAAAEVGSFAADVVFHLAAQMNVRKSVEEPAFDATANVVGIVNMLESAQRAGTKHFVFSSTGGAIYGEQDFFPADESHPIRPKSPYGVSKRAGELYLEYFAREGKMHCSSMRFANVYGPRQNPKGEAGVVAIFAQRLLNGEAIRVNGDGSQTRDFVFVSEVVDACIRAYTNPPASDDGSYRVFNVGTGIEASINDIVGAFQEIVNSLDDVAEPQVEHGPALAGEQQRSVVSAVLLSNELKWESSVSLRDGLALTLDSFRK